MFQFPALASIRRSAGQRSFAPHRGFSQLITSFIASESLGIHHVPLSTSFPSAALTATDYTLGSCVLLLLGLYNMSKILFLN